MSGGRLTFRHEWVLRAGQESSLSDGARLLGIMAMMEFGKPDAGAEFWPSHRALAELVGVSERTAERRMDQLAKANLIEKRSTGGGTSNRYVAIMPNPDNRDANPDNRDANPDNRDANPDNRDANPDSSDGVTPTPVSEEQTQEQVQLTDPDNKPTPAASTVDTFGKISQVPGAGEGMDSGVTSVPSLPLAKDADHLCDVWCEAGGCSASTRQGTLTGSIAQVRLD